MKQTKVNELSSLARSQSDIEDLTADERKFYKDNRFYEHRGQHKGVVVNPTQDDKEMIKAIASKITIIATFIQEPDDNGNITRHKIISV